MTHSANTVTNSAWLMSGLSGTEPSLRLFCLPYAGGGAAAYAQWINCLPREVEVCRVQLPGRENRWREAPFTSITSLAEILAEAIRPYLDRPFAFFGHSLGAFISFELARQVRRRWELSPAQLFVSARWAPHLSDPEPLMYQLPDGEFIDTLRQRYNNIPDVVANDPELTGIFLPLLRADVTMLDTYVYTADHPFDCPITAFGGSADQRVTRAALAAWRTHTTQAFRVQVFPGDHFYLHSARDQLLQTLSQELTLLLCDV